MTHPSNHDSHLDDPRLTAYALGELDDPADRAEIEELLKTSPEARAYVEDMGGLADTLASELTAEPAPTLTGTQRDAVLGGDAGGDVISVPRRPGAVTGRRWPPRRWCWWPSACGP